MKKSPQDLGQLMLQTKGLPDVVERAELLQQLNYQVKQMVPANVAKQLRVANFRKGTGILVIETTSSVWAVRVNHQKPMLLSQLRAQSLPMLTAIEVKVNPALARKTNDTDTKVVHRQMTETAASYIEALAEHTQGSLGQKLKRLAALASRNRQS